MEKLFIAYYRVSTKMQSVSGLGLEAQKASVLNYIKHNGNRIIGEFTEVESGKNNNRPELLKAINEAKQNNATLVIAKLDRLSRNLTFISTLMDTKVKFICADMPDANELTISIFASLAQWERKKISQRTKEALKAKKEREPNWIPGTPANLTKEAILKAHASTSYKARNDMNVRHAYHYIAPLRDQGQSYQAIATMLNEEGYKTRSGMNFHAMQVYNILRRFESLEAK